MAVVRDVAHGQAAVIEDHDRGGFAEITGAGDLSVEGGKLTLSGILSQYGGVFISSGELLNIDSLQATADVATQSGTTLNLMNGSTLTGRILDDGIGGGDLSSGKIPWANVSPPISSGKYSGIVSNSSHPPAPPRI